MLKKNNNTYQRSQAFFKSSDGWYFKTRENADLGPYTSLEHARVNRIIYAEAIQQSYPSTRGIERHLQLKQVG